MDSTAHRDIDRTCLSESVFHIEEDDLRFCLSSRGTEGPQKHDDGGELRKSHCVCERV